MNDFTHSRALIIGIDDYHNGIPPLHTAANDARRLAQILKDQHGYEVDLLLDEQASAEAINNHLLNKLTGLTENDRILFYFAGHGTALDSDGGPRGYLIPQDGDAKNPASFLQMHVIHEALNNLACRHLLVILDSCFSGAFRWSATRDFISAPPVLYKERYDRFIRDPAWQVITSASHDQKASDQAFHDLRGQVGEHSPFALALFEALETDAADRFGDTKGADGVVTAEELFLYLEETVQPASEEAGQRQTPELWTLDKHDKGQFIFHVGELHLASAPELKADSNPYRGLKSYEKEHAPLFFGRDAEIETLSQYVAEHPLAVVLGASGTGKSSLVKAGLVPKLMADLQERWEVLEVIRPGASPIRAIVRAMSSLEERTIGKKKGVLPRLAQRVATWCNANPGKQLVLVIDQFEELITMTSKSSDRESVLLFLVGLLDSHPAQLRIILTLRTDFEPQFSMSVLENYWQKGRYIVPAISREDLRKVIEGPAKASVIYFDPSNLVEKLVDEVVATPGGLPLLSFTLSEMYIRLYDRFTRETGVVDRSMTEADYEALGGVIGSLRKRANDEYEAFDEAKQDTMRRVILRMVSLSGGNITRQRVRKSELDYPDEAETERVREVVNHLADEARLLVTGKEEDGEPYVEPAHDALVRAWDNLIQWIHHEDWDEHHERRPADLRFQKELASAARAWTVQKNEDGDRWWQSLRRSKALLWRGDKVRILVNVELSKWLNKTEKNFALQSIRWRLMTRSLNLGSIAMILIVASWGLYNAKEMLKASQSFTEQTEQIKKTHSKLLAAHAHLNKESELDLAMLLGVQSKHVQKTSASRLVLSQMLQDHPNLNKILDNHAGIVRSISFSPDGMALATASTNNTVRLWHLETGESRVLEGHSGPVNSVMFSVDGQTLASASADSTIRLWNTRSGEVIDTLAGHQGPVHSLAFSPDSTTLLSGSGDRTLGKWDLRSGTLVESLKDHNSSVLSVAFSKDGTMAASGSTDGEVLFWHINSGKKTEARQQGPAKHAIFSPDGKTLASTSDNNVLLWNTDSGEVIRKFEGHQDIVRGVAFTPDGKTLVSASYDDTIRIWNAGTGEHIKTIEGHTGSINDVDINPHSMTLASASTDSTVRIWDTRSWWDEGTFNDQEGDDNSSTFNPNGQALEPAFGDKIARLWDINSGTNPSLQKGFSSRVLDIAYGPDSLLVATSTYNNSFFFNVKAYWKIHVKGEDPYPDKTEAVNPDSMIIGYALSNNTIALRNAKTALLKGTLTGHQAAVNSIAFYPKKEMLASGSDDGTIRIWRTNPPTISDTLVGHLDPVNSVTFSPSGRRIVSGSDDHTLQLWDSETGAALKKLRGHRGPVHSVIFSPDSLTIASASEDSTVRIWDVATGKNFMTLKGHQSPVKKIAFNQDGKLLASVSADRNVRLWDLNFEGRACGIANRNLTQMEWDLYIGGPYLCTCEAYPAGAGAPPDAPGCKVPESK